MVATLIPLIRSVDRHIEAVAAEIPAAQLLRTVPGIGAYRSSLIVAETWPIQGFAKPAHPVALGAPLTTPAL
ncbi:MAG: hypothetical protein GEU90_02205 [Gemmatimonas sp.]|nr:hypothetical protein [Gemmatimonas sp.]